MSVFGISFDHIFSGVKNSLPQTLEMNLNQRNIYILKKIHFHKLTDFIKLTVTSCKIPMTFSPIITTTK